MTSMTPTTLAARHGLTLTELLAAIALLSLASTWLARGMVGAADPAREAFASVAAVDVACRRIARAGTALTIRVGPDSRAIQGVAADGSVLIHRELPRSVRARVHCRSGIEPTFDLAGWCEDYRVTVSPAVGSDQHWWVSGSTGWMTEEARP